MLVNGSFFKKISGLLLLLFAVCLLLYCEDPEQISRERTSRLSQKDKEPIRAKETDSYYGIYKASDYEGEHCDNLSEEDQDYEKCRKICDTIYGKKADECEDLPVELIFDLEELYNNMVWIRAKENQLDNRINAFDFGVMIDVDVEPVLLLINAWSEREIKEFIYWVAVTSSVALALKHHDEDNVILKEAVKKLGVAAYSGNAAIEYGLGQNLRSHGDTFWVIIERNKNKNAFIIAHKLVMDICSTKNCKLKLYCLREEFQNAFARQNQCHYARDRRSFSSKNCYTHGPSVWSYWENLNSEGEFEDSDFPNTEKLNETVCDKVCQTETCTIGG